MGDRLHGVSSRGGQTDCGTLFSMAYGGAFETHLSLACENGGYPRAGLTEGPGGALYGATPVGDEGGAGLPDGVCPADQVLFAGGADVRSTAVTVTDAAGNVSSPSNVVVLKIDKTAPTLAPTMSQTPVLLNSWAIADAHGSDTLSGVTFEVCHSLDRSTVGPNSITCFAADAAGNPASAVVNYVVQYRFSGVQQPVNDPANPACAGCAMSVFRDGSTIAVKFQLTDAFGVAVASPTAPAGSHQYRWAPRPLA